MRILGRLLTSLTLIALFFVFPNTSFAQQQVTVAQGYSNILAQGIIFANICTTPAPDDGTGDTCQCRAQGICSLSEVTQLAINFIIFILGICGSVALCMFIYGGFNWVFAQGREGYIQTGKDTMKHAVIGLAIIFGAYAMVNLIIAILGGIDPGTTIEDTIDTLPATQDGSPASIDASSVIESH